VSGIVPYADGGSGGGGVTLPTPPIPPAGGPPPLPATAKSNVTATSSPSDGQAKEGEKLWMRKWKLSIGNPTGSKALDLSLLDFEFHVDRQWLLVPSIARIKIYNPNDEILNGMKELVKVHLEGGYQEPSKQYGDLFNGQINYFKSGRQNATDTYVEIFASEYDTAVNAAVVNTWLPAGWVEEDAINAVLSAMTPYGITLGQIPESIDKTKHPRGRLFFGMARDHLRDIERTQRGRFFTDGTGKLHLLKDDEALKISNESVPILNRKTGLIDIPTRTLDGAVEMQSLLNPNVHPGGKVKIDNKDVRNVTRVDVTNLVADAYKISESERLYSADGFYVVYSVKHQGQTRGNPWYSNMVTQKSLPEPGLRTSAGG